MNNVQDLRRTLERHAGQAPDGAGVVQLAQVGAQRIRRRRAWGASAASVVAVLAVGVGVPVAARHGTPAPIGTETAPYRTTLQLTLGLTAGRGFTVINRGTEVTRQFLVVRNDADIRSERPGAPGRNPGAEVFAYDPGTFDPAPLLRGERVSVSGQEAYYVPSMPGPGTGAGTDDDDPTGPAVAWRDPSGVWLLVVYPASTGRDPRADLIEVAQAVRLRLPERARAPFQLGWVPDGLPVSFVELADAPGLDLSASVAFGGDRRPPTTWMLPAVPRDAELTVQAVPASNRDWRETIRPGLGAPTRIEGHDTWYEEGSSDVVVDPGSGSSLIVDAGSCITFITVRDRTRITAAELTTMAERASFGDCGDAATWAPIVR